MGLKGDLKSISLANVLQDLAQNEQNGTLSLTGTDRQIHFWFEKGQLRLVGLGKRRGPSLLNGLLAIGKIQLADLGANPKLDAEAALTRALLKRNAVSREDARAALQQQMFELVCDAFLWNDASFEFIQGDPRDEQFDTNQLDHEIRLACDPLIMEALRRIDEWPEIKKSVLSPQEVFVADGTRQAEGLDALTARVLALMDGQRRLRDIIEITHLGTFNVFKAAASLKAGGLIRSLSGKEALDRARLFASKSQWEAALRMARFALEHEPSNPVLRQIAAEALEKLERRDEAAAEYRQLAAAQAETGDPNGAIATCRKILALAPRDTFTLERLFQLFLETGQKEQALSQGEALAAAYKRAGLPDKAIELYTRLMSALGDSDDLLEATAEIARHLGDRKEAIQIYRRLFERALARGDEDIALQLSRTLLRLDPSQEDIAQRRIELETGVYRKRIAFRRRLKFLAAGAVVIALGGAAGVYEWMARSEHGSIRAESIQLAAKGDYLRILERYDRLTAGFRYSLTCRSAEEERGTIENLHADTQLGTAAALEKEDRLLEAIAAAESVRDWARSEKNRQRAEERLVALRKKRNDEENSWLERTQGYALAAKTDPSAIAKLEAVTHPLALAALGLCLKNEQVAVRRAAVAALRKVLDDGALELIVRAFATDGDAKVREDAQAALAERTGQKFTTALQWDEWLRKRAAERAPASTPPLQATLVLDPDRAPGQPIALRWELRNIGASNIDFTLPADFGPVFEGLGPTGRALITRAEERGIRLRPGEYIGGRVAVEGVPPGNHSITWTGSVRWNGTGSVQVKSLPLVLDVPKQ